MTKKLLKKDFYDIYGISLLFKVVDSSDLKVLANCLNDLADKFLKITWKAVCGELEHAFDGGSGHNINTALKRDSSYCNLQNLKYFIDNGFDMFKMNEKYMMNNYTWDQAIELFKNLNWMDDFGGDRWADIALAGKKLAALSPVTKSNIGAAIVQLDRIIDLEHNTDLYLNNFCFWDLKYFLDELRTLSPAGIFKGCSKEIRDMYKDYRALIK